MRKTKAKLQVTESKRNSMLDSQSADIAQYQSMKGKFLTVEQVLEILRKRQGERTQREFAAELGITGQYLCDLYLRRRDPGEKVLENLGIVRRTIYEQVA